MGNAYDKVMESRKEIVDRLIAQMEKGYAATRAAWNKAATGRPYNPISDAVYKGGNRFRLMLAAEENGFSDPRWMTFKQASENNYRIASGAKGVLLEKWIFYKDVPKLDATGKIETDEAGNPILERHVYKKPIVNYFRVFNGEQVIGLPELTHREITEDTFSRMAETFEKSSLCPVSYEMQDRAYYSSVEDKIHLPLREAFKNNETRLSVLLHEMAHSTGHESRLDRPLKNGFGTEAYAKEELNAELSSVFLENELGIVMEPDSEMLKDHANYVKSWISVLRDNPNELFVACATAEQITDFLMEHYERQVEQRMELDKLTLEERYTEAMKMVGYERIEDFEGFLAFQDMNSGESIMIDGWKLVGLELEEKTPLNEADAARYKKLLYPEGRLSYYTQNLGGTGQGEDALQVTHKSFEEAFEAYKKSGLVDGKTLGFMINGENPVKLIWYHAANMENILYRAVEPATQYASDAAPNELHELQKNMRNAVDYLQRENTYIQLAQTVADFEMRAMPVILQAVPENTAKGMPQMERIAARFVSVPRPQDYIELGLVDKGYTAGDGDKKPTRMAELVVRTVHANEVINEKQLFVTSDDIEKNGIKAFEDKEFTEWLHKEVMDFDMVDMPYGQPEFTAYSSWGWQPLEEHYEKLENLGYERFPSDEAYMSEEMDLTFHEVEVGKDIDACGFTASQDLVENIIRFEQLEGRTYTLRELAELKRQNPDFKSPEKQECFRKIVEECRSQEIKKNQEKVSFLNQEKETSPVQNAEQAQSADAVKSNFLKQELLMEQMQMMPG